MSDLQCPAYAVLATPASILSQPAGAALRHVARVYLAGPIATDADASGAAARVAAPSGCAVETLANAVDGDTLREEVDDLSDLHRGETIWVLAPGDMIERALRRPRPAGPVTVAIDSSGWRVVEPGAE